MPTTLLIILNFLYYFFTRLFKNYTVM